MCRRPGGSVVVRQVTARGGPPPAVLLLLALRAQLDIRHELQPPPGDRLITLTAEPEVLPGLLDAGQRGIDLTEKAGAVLVPLGSDRLAHLVERLRIVISPDHRGIRAVGLDGDIAL